MLSEKEGLWYRVLKARYREVGGRVREGGQHDSLWWRSVCSVRGRVNEGVGSWFDGNVRRMVGDGRTTLFWFDHWVGEMPLRIKFPRLFDLAINKESTVEEMASLGWEVEGRAWEWRRRLLAWEEDSVKECSEMLHNIVLQVEVADSWRWLLDPVHGYSVRNSYRFLTTSEEQVDRSPVDDVWHIQIPLKVSLFVWRLLRNRLPTKDNLLRRHVIYANDLAYVTGCGATETATHLFIVCDLAHTLWVLVWNWIGLSMVPPCQLRDHFMQVSFMAGMSRGTHSFFKVIWFACVWVIWKERNNRIFKDLVSPPVVLLEKVKLLSFVWLKANHASFNYSFHDWWRYPIPCMGVC